MPVQLTGEVLSVKRVGAYTLMTVVAPGMPELTRPGHFVAVQVGGPESSMLLRRAFALYDVQERGVYGGTVQFVFAVHGKGTAWLAERRPQDVQVPRDRPGVHVRREEPGQRGGVDLDGVAGEAGVEGVPQRVRRVGGQHEHLAARPGQGHGRRGRAVEGPGPGQARGAAPGDGGQALGAADEARPGAAQQR